MKISSLASALFLGATVILLPGCGKDESSSNGEDGSAIAGLGLPSDYFPTAIGTRWTYEVTVTEENNDPVLIHRVTDWPLGDGKGAEYETRGRLFQHKAATDGHSRLIIAVTNTAAAQGPLQYPEGYALNIERDDFGVFDDACGLFWAITKSGGYQVTQVVTYDPERTPGAPSGGEWGSYGQEPGTSMTVLFFGSGPMTSMGLHGGNETTLFVGPETFNGAQSLHFRRIVDPDTKSTDITDDHSASFLAYGFSEDMWFVKGVGLAKLVQTVNGKVTMTWDLVN